MTGRIFTSDHHVYDLPTLLEWNVVHTGTVPCDSYSVTFLYQKEMAEVLHLAAGFAAIEKGETMLRGIVDEYTVELGGSGMTATVSGRGYAARLLDNESRPVTYQAATLEEIVRCHVTPYGLTCGEVADVRADSVYTVAAGTSQWKALENFCRTYGGFSPRFARDGKLLAAPEQVTGRYLIIGDDDPVLECTLREDHYGVLTEVLVIDKKSGMSYSVKNPDMVERGGAEPASYSSAGRKTLPCCLRSGVHQ